jgi:hypothetical protein
MENLNIQIPEGYEIDLQKSDLTRGYVAFKQSKKELPKTWCDLEDISGFYVCENCEVESEMNTKTYTGNTNLFATEAQAKASLALAQLSQLRQAYRQGWVPDFCNPAQIKHAIMFRSKITTVDILTTTGLFLTFQSADVARQFLDNFRNLIKEAEPLLT